MLVTSDTRAVGMPKHNGKSVNFRLTKVKVDNLVEFVGGRANVLEVGQLWRNLWT